MSNPKDRSKSKDKENKLNIKDDKALKNSKSPNQTNESFNKTRNTNMLNNQQNNENTSVEKTSDLFGYGKFEFQNKILYIGHYKIKLDGTKVRHGYGKIIHPSTNNSSFGQEVYEGDWVEDKMHGFGIYKYSNGDTYEGEWRENLQEGLGKYYFTDGTKYEGEWKNHLMHGSGHYLDINGILWSGEFREGTFISKEQSKLKEEKRIEKKIEKLGNAYLTFVKAWEEVYAKQGKETRNIRNRKKAELKGKPKDVKLSDPGQREDLKETLSGFFTDEQDIGQYILGPYPKIKERSIAEWNSIITRIKDDFYQREIHVPKNTQSLFNISKSRVLAYQLQDELSSGQVIEIRLKDNKKSYLYAIAYIKESDRWVLVDYREENLI